MSYDPTAAGITATTSVYDQEKFLASHLIARSMYRLVSMTLCDPVKQPEGAGLTAYFVRYQRMNVPMATISEGVDPTGSTFSLQQLTVTLDQWGDVLVLSDVTQLTTKHPLLQEAINLLSDNAMRVIDREVQLVWLAGTNVQYFDGSVTTRPTLGAGSKINDTCIHKAVVTHVDNGTPPRGGPSGGIVLGGAGGAESFLKGGGIKDIGSAGGGASINQGTAYVGVCGPQVMHDIMTTSTSLGTWVSVAMYANQKALYNGEVGTWLNVRWVETNFIPKFQLLGNTTTAVTTTNSFGTNTPTVTTATTGGSLTDGTTYYYKVTRKDLLRGFEEFISIEHTTVSTSSANTNKFTFDFSSLTAGFVYNIYFGSSTGDANLKQFATTNIAVGSTAVVTAVPSSTVTAPAAPASGITVHPVYIHGEESCNWVMLQNLQVMISADIATVNNPLKLRRSIGYKFLGKAMIRDQLRILRLEVASGY